MSHWRECEILYEKLLHSAAPKEYLNRDRGIPDSTISDLRIGYCDYNTKDSLGINLEGRITFPIKDLSGDILGFGGRIFDGESDSKYINPSSESYDKSGTLYNLDIASDYILASGSAIVVEGYTDVASLWTYGVRNVVATCGTAMTRRQLRLIKRFAEEVYILYDDDKSGNSSASRVLKSLEIESFPVYIASGLCGMDPDEYVRMMGAEAILEVIYEAKAKKR